MVDTGFLCSDGSWRHEYDTYEYCASIGLVGWFVLFNDTWSQ